MEITNFFSRKKSLPNTNGSSTKPKKAKVNGMTIEQHRRKMGDAVKLRLSMEKYCMKADCHAMFDLPTDIFRNLVVPNSVSVIPETFTTETPVVVASIVGAMAAGEVFGKSKIKGGNRYETCEVQKVEFVFFPTTQTARIWWVMYGRYDEDGEDAFQ